MASSAQTPAMLHHNLDPVAFRIGGLEMHWYGIMYLVGFALGWLLGRYRAGKPGSGWTKTEVDDLLTCTMLGVILGGRLGYVLFYDFANYLEHPLEILKIWHGGMSFHGGLLGALFSFWYFAHTRKLSFWNVSDFVSPLVPQALFWGRLGNFINGELWGKVTDLPWGIVFKSGGNVSRHPSQLYEALLEGLALFVVLWIYSAKKRKPGQVSGVFAIGYGLARISVEFVRMPDAHIGYLAYGWLTMGQLLCFPLILVGIWLVWRPQPQKEKLLASDKKN